MAEKGARPGAGQAGTAVPRGNVTRHDPAALSQDTSTISRGAPHLAALSSSACGRQGGDAQGAASAAARLGRKYQLLQDLSPVGFLILDAEGAILEANRAMAGMLGLEQAALTGRRLATFLDDAGRVCLGNFLRDLARTGERGWCEVTLRPPDGGTLPVSVQAVFSADDGDAPTYVLSVANAGEREALQAALRDSRARLRAIFDAAPDAIVIVDDRGIITVFNATAERLFGYRAAEVEGNPVFMLMPQPFRDRQERFLSRYLRYRKPLLLGRLRHLVARRRDGTTFPVELSVGEGERDGRRVFAGFMRDMTAREAAADQARRRQAELARVSRLAEMAELASALAHELNQPLTAILNYLEASVAISGAPGEAGSEQGHKFTVLALDQANRAGQIIRRLREFIGKGRLERSNEDANAVVRNSVALALTALPAMNCELRFHLEPALPPVFVDRVQIQQVIVNLVRNSLDALQGIDEAMISISSARCGEEMISISVVDNGPGIPEEVRRKLFKPLVTTKPTGMGIGLSLCRSVIEAHGGTLGIMPNPSGGTICRFTIPVAGRLEGAAHGG